jgi:hypothetical protein
MKHKPKLRKNPLSINNIAIVNIIDHPEIYCDGVLLLEDLDPEQVQKWYAEKSDKLYCRKMNYEDIKRIYPNNISLYAPAKFTGYKKNEVGKMVAVLQSEDNEVHINDEYYLFLEKLGYQFLITKTNKYGALVLLKRNNKIVGAIAPIIVSTITVNIRTPQSKKENKK